MQSFEITSLIRGSDTTVTVYEPQPWNSNQFKVSFESFDQNFIFTLGMIQGQWRVTELPVGTKMMLDQPEVNSIGYKISRHWSHLLKEQLNDFEFTF